MPLGIKKFEDEDIKYSNDLPDSQSLDCAGFFFSEHAGELRIIILVEEKK